MSNYQPLVLDVGQCDFDHANISRMLTNEFHADVRRASTVEEAFQAVRDGDYNLVLINRVFDSDGDLGIGLIERLKAADETRETPIVLVSNYADAQESAVALGAQPGFGKGSLDSSETRDALATALGVDGG